MKKLLSSTLIILAISALLSGSFAQDAGAVAAAAQSDPPRPARIDPLAPTNAVPEKPAAPPKSKPPTAKQKREAAKAAAEAKPVEIAQAPVFTGEQVARVVYLGRLLLMGQIDEHGDYDMTKPRPKLEMLADALKFEQRGQANAREFAGLLDTLEKLSGGPKIAPAPIK